MNDKVRAQLAPTGVLRAGINLSNFLLVTGRSESGDPTGVAPDMARELSLSGAEIGLLSSIFFLTFAAAQLPLGVIIDRHGPKRIMLWWKKSLRRLTLKNYQRMHGLVEHQGRICEFTK